MVKQQIILVQEYITKNGSFDIIVQQYWLLKQWKRCFGVVFEIEAMHIKHGVVTSYVTAGI